MSEQVKRYDIEGSGLRTASGDPVPASVVDERDYDALAQRCRELLINHGLIRDELESEKQTAAAFRAERDAARAEVERLTKIVGSQVVRRFVGNDQQREIDELVALGIEQDKQEIADIKARLLDAERGAEELVRLRAENRGMRDLLAESADYLNTNQWTRIEHSSVLHRKMMEASK